MSATASPDVSARREQGSSVPRHRRRCAAGRRGRPVSQKAILLPFSANVGVFFRPLSSPIGVLTALLRSAQAWGNTPTMIARVLRAGCTVKTWRDACRPARPAGTRASWRTHRPGAAHSRPEQATLGRRRVATGLPGDRGVGSNRGFQELGAVWYRKKRKCILSRHSTTRHPGSSGIGSFIISSSSMHH